MVALDHRGRPVAAARLDEVGVERALHEELGLGQAAGVLLEDADELVADRLALLLRVDDPVRGGRRSGRRRRRGSARGPCAGGRSRSPRRSRRGASARCRRRRTSGGGRSPGARGRRRRPSRRRPTGAQIARPSPICSRTRATCSSTTDAIVHVGAHRRAREEAAQDAPCRRASGRPRGGTARRRCAGRRPRARRPGRRRSTRWRGSPAAAS